MKEQKNNSELAQAIEGYNTLKKDIHYASYFNMYPAELSVEKLITKGKTKIKTSEAAFKTPAEFLLWWVNAWKLQQGSCYYCNSKFSDLAKLINSNLLAVRKIGYGVRGPFPEIERLESTDEKNIYSKENCVLACYYCNNDKSYVYSSVDYKNYFGPAKGLYIKQLLTKLKT
ncbi:hypothetical protein CIK05_11845 [Bdellovibrio sp. qaytius]|nr:hypothetical protein CIK05_11845 [Bdellovibrio sp. qaytius]